MAKTTASMKTLGKNISYVVDGTELTIKVDLSKDFGPSTSGKTVIIASSEGNKDVGGAIMGLNVYKYPTAKASKK